ncbi:MULTISPECIES: zf-HC2 domain-containing protein [unclassified Aurantimonas]|uniref:anti-sigma factor family protein n=1 Tax=unclassified Aurantimonas TaxID=2638230 RepID=UPI002E19A510|nr:zf-HC2 domain-containing protein [Aurantimonas sp. A3-2-R12]
MKTMLTCRDLAQQADAFLDGELNLGQRLRIRLHLSMCNGCARFMGQMRQTRSLITAEARNAASGEDNTAVDTDIDNILDAFHDGKQSGG